MFASRLDRYNSPCYAFASVREIPMVFHTFFSGCILKTLIDQSNLSFNSSKKL